MSGGSLWINQSHLNRKGSFCVIPRTARRTIATCLEGERWFFMSVVLRTGYAALMDLTLPAFLLYQNSWGCHGNPQKEQRSTSWSFSFYKRLYYPIIKGVFNKPFFDATNSITLGSRLHAKHVGWSGWRCFVFTKALRSIFLLVCKFVETPTRRAGMWRKTVAWIQLLLFSHVFLLSFFFEASQNLSWGQNRDKLIHLEKICFLIHVLPKSHELYFACINLGWALPKTVQHWLNNLFPCMAHVLTLIIHCERVCGQVSKFRDECSPESKHIHINSYPLKNECLEDDIPFGKVRFHRDIRSSSGDFRHPRSCSLSIRIHHPPRLSLSLGTLGRTKTRGSGVLPKQPRRGDGGWVGFQWLMRLEIAWVVCPKGQCFFFKKNGWET